MVARSGLVLAALACGGCEVIPMVVVSRAPDAGELEARPPRPEGFHAEWATPNSILWAWTWDGDPGLVDRLEVTIADEVRIRW